MKFFYFSPHRRTLFSFPNAQNKYVELISKRDFNKEILGQLETVTLALGALLKAQNDMANQIPSMGHLGKLVASMDVSNQPVQNSLLIVLNEMMSSKLCIRSFGSEEHAVKGLKAAMSNASSVCLKAKGAKRVGLFM